MWVYSESSHPWGETWQLPAVHANTTAIQDKMREQRLKGKPQESCTMQSWAYGPTARTSTTAGVSDPQGSEQWLNNQRRARTPAQAGSWIVTGSLLENLLFIRTAAAQALSTEGQQGGSPRSYGCRRQRSGLCIAPAVPRTTRLSLPSAS